MSTPRPSGSRANTRFADLMSDCEDGTLAIRRVVVSPRDVVYLKGILEASRGLGLLFAEQGGELALVTARSRERELDELIDDLTGEIPLRRRCAHERDAASGGVQEACIG